MFIGQPVYRRLSSLTSRPVRNWSVETYRLLGAQIIGYEGVDKRIDVLATAIHAGLKATQLKDLDLAYAPPYSSAKDPVNMAGFMIDNIAKGTLKQWHLEDMDKISKDKNVVLLDVRTVGEFNRGHMKGFNNIPVDELRERISEIEKGKPVDVYKRQERSNNDTTERYRTSAETETVAVFLQSGYLE